MILRNVEILGRPGLCDVNIEGRTIRSINSGTSPAAASIDFEGALAFPGLINSHDHLEFDCYEQLDGGPYRDYIEWGSTIHRRHATTIAAVEAVPRDLRIRAGIAKNVLCGVTSVAHHGPAVESAGQPIHVIEGTRAIHSPRLGRLRPMLLPDRRTIVAHIGEGVDVKTEREIDTFIRWNVWRKRLIGVHAIAMREDQAEHFAAVVWCPVSNDFLFGRAAPIARLKERTTVLFGTDSTLTASWSIWDHLRRARECGALTDDELIASVTTSAARAWNLPNRGCMATGATADLVVARKRCDDQRDAFFAINPEDILLVVSSGAVVVLDPSLSTQPGVHAKLFPVDINGVEKLAAQDYSKLARRLRSFVPSIPIPITGTHAKPIAMESIFRCPQCARTLALPERCECGFAVNEANGILDLMTARESAAVQPFVRVYEQIRAAEEWGGDDLDLPFHPKRHGDIWEIRRRTFQVFKSIVMSLERGLALDIGAGNCWLTRYLDRWGFDAIAMDINTGHCDGLRAGQKFINEGGEFVRVRAGMERLPFTSGQIRLLAANGSFHYVSDFRATLAEFERVLCPGGVIAILDSPFYENAEDGERGIAERVAEFRSKYGIPEEFARKARYFTFDDFKAAANALKLRIRVEQVWPGWYRKREEIHARIRGRGSARFPVVFLEKYLSNI